MNRWTYLQAQDYVGVPVFVELDLSGVSRSNLRGNGTALTESFDVLLELVILVKFAAPERNGEVIEGCSCHPLGILDVVFRNREKPFANALERLVLSDLEVREVCLCCNLVVLLDGDIVGTSNSLALGCKGASFGKCMDLRTADYFDIVGVFLLAIELVPLIRGVVPETKQEL